MPRKKTIAVDEAAKKKTITKKPVAYVDPYVKSLLDQGFVKDEETGDWIKKGG